jgi:hypothetical protein
MAKYRITIENLEGGDYENNNVIDCDGFVILGDHGKSFGSVIHDVSRVDIATMIAEAPKVYAAAVMAQGIHESEKAYRAAVLQSKLSQFMEDKGE